MRLALLLAAAASVAAATVSALPVTPFPPDVGSSNVLDVLNASPEHRILVRLLQRARLIPAINTLQHNGVNLTFIAPVDAAWPRSVQSAFASDVAPAAESEQLAALATLVGAPPHTADNINTQLNELLRYHIIDRDLAPDLLHPPKSRQLETTLYVPRHKGPGGGGDGGEGAGEPLLNGKQKVFVYPGKNTSFGWSYGRPADQSAVARIAQGAYAVNCSRGAVVAVDGVLSPPPPLLKLIQSHPQLKSLAHLVKLGMGKAPLPVPLNSRALTAFFPSDQAFSPTASNGPIHLTSDEAAWLRDPNETLAAQDRAKFLAWHIVAGERTLYRPSHAEEQDIVMTLGGTHLLSHASRDVRLGPAPVVEETVLVENGVVHLLGAPLSPYLPAPAKAVLPMNVHRVLVARGARKFATLLHQNGLSWAIAQPAWPTLEDPDNPEDDWPARPRLSAPHKEVPPRLTILAVPDARALQDDKEQLQYHILPAGWGWQNLTASRHLLDTELRPPGLGGDRQRLDVRVQGQGATRGITFGGKGVQAIPPLSVGARGDIIWLLEDALLPPTGVVDVLKDLSKASAPVDTFRAWIARANRTENLVNTSVRLTGLIPVDDALSPTRLGSLLQNALVHVRGKLDQLVQAAFINDVVYTSRFPHASGLRKERKSGQRPLKHATIATDSYPTLGGGNLSLATVQPDDPEANATLKAFIPERKERYATLAGAQDILTDTGALHLLDSLLFPANLTITIADLLLSSGLVEMHELISTTRFAHILGVEYNATLPPAPSAPRPYVVLAPVPQAFTPELLETLRNNSDARESFVSRHLLKLPGATEDCGLPDTRVERGKKKLWPPAPPGAGPSSSALASLLPIDLTNGATWGTCANHRLNQVDVRILPPKQEGVRAWVSTSPQLPSNQTVAIGVLGAYGPSKGALPTAHILDRGIQLVAPGEVGGGVLLLDAPIPYDPQWDAPPLLWAVWGFGLVALLAALVPIKSLVGTYFSSSSPAAGPAEPAQEPLLAAEHAAEQEQAAEPERTTGGGE